MIWLASDNIQSLMETHPDGRESGRGDKGRFSLNRTIFLVTQADQILDGRRSYKHNRRGLDEDQFMPSSLCLIACGFKRLGTNVI